MDSNELQFAAKLESLKRDHLPVAHPRFQDARIKKKLCGFSQDAKKEVEVSFRHSSLNLLFLFEVENILIYLLVQWCY